MSNPKDSFRSKCHHNTGVCIWHIKLKYANLSQTKITRFTGNYHFRSSDLELIELPSCLEVIPHFIFAYSKLKSLTLPPSVTKIDPGGLCGCYFLTEINCNPDNPYFTVVDGILYSKDITMLVKYPQDCNKTFLPSVTSFSHVGCFAGTNITEFNCPRSIKSFGSRSFHKCPVLKVINLSQSPATLIETYFLPKQQQYWEGYWEKLILQIWFYLQQLELLAIVSFYLVLMLLNIADIIT